jgi:hypothetical protein
MSRMDLPTNGPVLATTAWMSRRYWELALSLSTWSVA